MGSPAPIHCVSRGRSLLQVATALKLWLALIAGISRLVRAVQLRKGYWHLSMPKPCFDTCMYKAIQISSCGCVHRGYALMERVHVCRVYSKRQAVPGLKKRKTTASKLAINRLDGLYCAHVIHKRPTTRNASGLPRTLEYCRNAPHVLLSITRSVIHCRTG